jgi:hypothetical protein
MALVVPDSIIPSPDLEQARRALDLLIPPGSTFEVRGLPSRRSYVGRDLDHAIAAVRGMAGDCGIYWMMNPLRGDLTRAASDRDVLRRHWLMVDIDPVRPKEDGSATDLERRDAAAIGWEIRRDLAERSWPEPLMIDTGNGMQLLYRVDLPNNDQARLWVRGLLEALDKSYSTDRARVDTSVHNASRISRLPGTWNRKGTNTPTRPHRLCQLIHTPDAILPVSDALIAEMVTAPAASVPAVVERSALTVPAKLPTGSESGWYRKALENEAAQVVLSPNGTRHNRLRDAALTTAGYLHLGHFTEAELRQTLTTAGERAGLDPADITDAIAWGVAKGREKPLPAHDKMVSVAKVAARLVPVAQPATDDRVTIAASAITPTKVEWLWPNRVPMGKLTTFAGWGGLGKSFVTMDLAARISVGGEVPHAGGECFDIGNVLILNTEDDPSDTSVPRLMEATSGVDLDRLRFLRPHKLNVFTLDDLETLDRAFEEMGGVRLVVIDPATAHLGAANDHKNAELRAVLMPLSLWAMARKVAVVLVTHVNKPQGGKVEALARVVGGVAWVNAVRAAVMFSKDPDDPARRLMVGMKNNLGPEQLGLAYKIVPTNGLARVEWDGLVETTADDAINGDKRSPRRANAADFLADQFRERREWESDELYRLGREAGVSRNAMFEAKGLLPIRAHKRGAQDGRTFWVWAAEDGWPE